MLKYFVHKIAEMSLYCAECGCITSHTIFARNFFSIRVKVLSGIPLACSCNSCKTSFMAFSQEIYFGASSCGNSEYAKVMERSRLVPGDWLYVKGELRPGRISEVYQTKTNDVTVVDFGIEGKKTFSRPVIDPFNEKAPLGYRLFPAQCGVALLGDPVYHVIRNVFGRVVGRVSDGEKDKFVVMLENGMFLFITLPEECQHLSDAELLKSLTDKIFKMYPETQSGIKLTVVNAILYLQGKVSAYFLKDKILQFLSTVSELRGFVDFLDVDACNIVSDSWLEREAYRVLENAASPLFNYSVNVKTGILQLRAYYIEDFNLTKVQESLRSLKGLRGIDFEIEKAPLEKTEIRKICQSVLKVLKDNSRMGRSSLRISPLDDDILIEGRVNSSLQKHLVSFFIKKEIPRIKLINRLRIENV